MAKTFSLSAVHGATADTLRQALQAYAQSQGGAATEKELSTNHPNCCVLHEQYDKSVVSYPFGFIEWDEASAFISRHLHAPVFALNVHGDDLWMYLLYFQGRLISKFNPIPQYWNRDITADELNEWQGNAYVAARYTHGCSPEQIDRYLRNWSVKELLGKKAYPDDLYPYGNPWQMIDFLHRTGVPFPLYDDGKPKGRTYMMHTRTHALKNTP